MKHFALILIVAVVACSGAACSSDNDNKTTPKPKPEPARGWGNPAPESKEVTSLVPDNAVAVLRFASGERGQELLESVRDDFSLPIPTKMLPMLCGTLGVDATGVRTDAALFLAIAPLESGGSGGPVMTLIAPSHDPDALADKFNRGKATVKGYAALSQDPKYKPGTSSLGRVSLGRGLQDADVSWRLDHIKLAKLLGRNVDTLFDGVRENLSQIAAPAGPKSGVKNGMAMLEGVVDWAESLSRATQSIDLAFSERDGEFDIQAQLHTDGKGPLAHIATGGDALVDVSAVIDPDLPLIMLMRLDPAVLTKFGRFANDDMRKTIPEEHQKMFADYAAEIERISELLTGEIAVGMGATEAGFQMSFSMKATDAEAYLREYIRLLGNPALETMGIQFRAEAIRTVGKTTVHRHRVSIDFEKYAKLMDPNAQFPPKSVEVVRSLLGKDGLLFEMAAKDGMVIGSIGTTGSIDAMLRASGTPAWLTKARTDAGGKIVFLVQMNFTAMVEGTTALIKTIAPGEETTNLNFDEPAHFFLSGAVRDSVYRFRLRFDASRAMKQARQIR